MEARIGLAGMMIEGEDYGEAEADSTVRGVAVGEEEAVGGGKANARPPRRRGVKVKRGATLRRKPRLPRDKKQRSPSPARSSAPVEEEYIHREAEAIIRSRLIWERRWAGRYGAFDDENKEKHLIDSLSQI
ncbi:hypothetical protein ZWY2020_007480 [Hordeum vulgare]|nr:hypothetical protein ZWY2020_007480 [Hordeum vulgare]